MVILSLLLFSLKVDISLSMGSHVIGYFAYVLAPAIGYALKKFVKKLLNK